MKTNELKAARVRNNVTLKDLSDEIGVNVTTLSRKERGLIPFTCEEVKIIKEFLKLSQDEIFNIFF